MARRKNIHLCTAATASRQLYRPPSSLVLLYYKQDVGLGCENYMEISGIVLLMNMKILGRPSFLDHNTN